MDHSIEDADLRSAVLRNSEVSCREGGHESISHTRCSGNEADTRLISDDPGLEPDAEREPSVENPGGKVN